LLSGLLPAPLSRDLCNERPAVGEKMLVTGTEIVQTCLPLRRPAETVLRALAVTHGPDIALKAVQGQTLQFGLPEGSLCRAFKQLNQRRAGNIPKVMFRIYEMVAREEVPVMLDDRNIAARRPEDAQRMLLPERYSGGLLENLHLDPPNVPAHPFIEDGTEKTAPGISRHCEWANVIFSLRLRLDHGQKAHVWSFDLLEELVHLKGMPDIVRIDHAQDIGIDAVLSQELISAHCFLVSRLTTLRDTIPVVHFSRPIQTQADSKILRRQKAAPLLIKERPIGLHSIRDPPV